MTLRNRFLEIPNKIECNSIEEEIDIRRQTKEKIDNTEKLKEEGKEQEFISVKILQDLKYEKNDEIVEITKIELKLERLGIPKKLIDFFKKPIIPKKYLHLVLQAKNKSLYNITKKLQYV